MGLQASIASMNAKNFQAEFSKCFEGTFEGTNYIAPL